MSHPHPVRTHRRQNYSYQSHTTQRPGYLCTCRRQRCRSLAPRRSLACQCTRLQGQPGSAPGRTDQPAAESGPCGCVHHQSVRTLYITSNWRIACELTAPSTRRTVTPCRALRPATRPGPSRRKHRTWSRPRCPLRAHRAPIITRNLSNRISPNHSNDKNSRRLARRSSRCGRAACRW